MHRQLGLLVTTTVLVLSALGVALLKNSHTTSPMTTELTSNPNDHVPGEHASATLGVGESVANHEVTVTFLTPYVQTPTVYEGDPQDLRWWQFRVIEHNGNDTLEFSLNQPYPQLRFHDTLIHLERGGSNTAAVVLRPLPPRPVSVHERDAAARAIAAVLETEPTFPLPIADQRVLEDRVWEIRVVPRETRRAHYEVRIDALTGTVLGLEPGGGS